MKKYLPIVTVILVLAFSGCCRKSGEPKAIVGVSFPEPPVEIATNEGFGMGLINYFNIIQLEDGTYRMYFSGNETSGVAEDEWSQSLYLAESSDGFHYELKCKIMDSLIESSVCQVEDKDWPYRLVGCQMEDDFHCLFLWKSKDGVEFTGRRLLSKVKHDTQNVLVPRGELMKLYSRVTQEHFKNRRITVAEYTLDGEQVSPTEVLAGDFLYNNAACKVDERFDLLFPTYYNTHGGTTDTCFFRCYLVDGRFVRELPCDLNQWVDEDEAWAIASPGFISIDGERYLAFNTRTESHDHSRTGMVSKYKLVKVIIEYE